MITTTLPSSLAGFSEPFIGETSITSNMVAVYRGIIPCKWKHLSQKAGKLVLSQVFQLKSYHTCPQGDLTGLANMNSLGVGMTLG